MRKFWQKRDKDVHIFELSMSELEALAEQATKEVMLDVLEGLFDSITEDKAAWDTLVMTEGVSPVLQLLGTRIDTLVYGEEK